MRKWIFAADFQIIICVFDFFPHIHLYKTYSRSRHPSHVHACNCYLPYSLQPTTPQRKKEKKQGKNNNSPTTNKQNKRSYAHPPREHQFNISSSFSSSSPPPYAEYRATQQHAFPPPTTAIYSLHTYNVRNCTLLARPTKIMLFFRPSFGQFKSFIWQYDVH